jgi:KipI family sensor histidine kinase inhibitor
MTDVRPFGESALLVEVDDAFAAQGFASALRRDPPAGVTAVVPGRASVLVELDVLAVDVDGLADALARLPIAPTEEGGRLRIIPVVYGAEHGPDLADVAGEAGISPEVVIALHAATEVTVLFGGFAPGFAYLGDVAPSLRVGRLPTPRTRTPAGSVALADGMTGIYPAELPGGWRVIGRTPVTLFDPHRSPPAYLVPGDRVRFAPIPAAEWEDHAEPQRDW